MSNKILSDDARLYFVPYILGNSSASHKLSAQIYRRFGIVSVICGERRPLLDLFDFTCRSIELTNTDSSRRICEELVWLASQGEYTLPILIPTSDKYSKILNSERERLEEHFVISSPEELFVSSPLSSMLK